MRRARPRRKMNFGDIIGQSALTGNLLRQMRSGQVVHAYLFAGEAGMGKRTLAEICARALVCQGSERPCDKCGPCQRALGGNHPDIEVIEPGWGAGRQGDKRPKSLSVDDVRALTDFLMRKPYEAGRSIAIIPRAQLMTPQAQNALLKTLETPPGDSVIFMTCDNVRAMLPTIVSRCRVVHFQPLAMEEVRDHLIGRGLAPERAHLLAALSGGSIGRALEMDGNEEYWNVRAAALDAVDELSSAADIANFSARLRDMREHADWVLDALEIYARDLMLNGQAQALNMDRCEQIARQAAHINGLSMLKGVIRARERLKSNVGWNGVLDMICFDALEG